jgi:hypothetical protein
LARAGIAAARSTLVDPSRRSGGVSLERGIFRPLLCKRPPVNPLTVRELRLESSDGKGRAQSPHPACGRFEAAHCAAHLAKNSAFGSASATDVAALDRGLDRFNATPNTA